MSPSPSGSRCVVPQTVALAVTEASQVGEARRAAAALARRLGFDEAEAAARSALVVTEAANNLVKHAGERRAAAAARGARRGRRGRGPGPGQGAGHGGRRPLPARRLLHGRHARAPAWGPSPGCRPSSTSTPLPSRDGPAGPALVRAAAAPAGRRDSASGVGQRAQNRRDGLRRRLGRGASGRRSLRAGRRRPGPRPAGGRGRRERPSASFARTPGLGPADILAAIHDALRGTRGAAVAVAEVDLDERGRPLRRRRQHRRERSWRTAPAAAWCRTTARSGHEARKVPGVHLSLSPGALAGDALRRPGLALEPRRLPGPGSRAIPP